MSLNVYIDARALTLIGGPSPPPPFLPNMAPPLRSLRFSPQGSLSLPRCDGRDEESGVHRAQPSRSYQQLPVCRLPDMPPAHPHQVTSCFLDLHDGRMDIEVQLNLRQKFLNCRSVFVMTDLRLG